MLVAGNVIIGRKDEGGSATAPAGGNDVGNDEVVDIDASSLAAEDGRGPYRDHPGPARGVRGPVPFKDEEDEDLLDIDVGEVESERR